MHVVAQMKVHALSFLFCFNPKQLLAISLLYTTVVHVFN